MTNCNNSTTSKRPSIPEGHSQIHTVCPHDCPDGCSILATVNNKTNKVVQVRGDPSNPITRGYLCNKVNHYLDFVYNENRVLYPHKRVGPKGTTGKFERISWDEALDTIAKNFKSTIDQYGSEAIQPYSYSGTLGMLGFWSMDQRFWNKLGAARLDQSICIYASYFAQLYTYGLADGPDTETLPDCELIVLWAHNPVTTTVHTIPFLQKAKQNGAKIIVIDPRETRSSLMLADWHIQPKPGTDGAFALAVMNYLVVNNLHDIDFLKEQTFGWEEFIEDELPQWTLERAAKITGVSAQDIERFAKLYASTKKSCVRIGYGMNRHQNSGQMSRAILVLPCFTGSWREKCGGIFYSSVLENWKKIPIEKLQRPDLGNRDEKRIINMVQIGRALTDNIGSDGEPLDPPIKSLFIYNSDPANCAPNTANVRKGLLREDIFTVVHDIFWTDTSKYADIVLPADTQLERSDLHAMWGHYYWSLSKACIPPLGESMRNTELFRSLAKEMGFTDDAFTQSDEDMIKELITSENNPLMEGITYEQLEEQGWARQHIESPNRKWTKIGWPTETGKIQIWSKDLEKEGQPPLPTYVPEKEGLGDEVATQKYPLQVLSSACHHFIGNSFQEVPRLQAMMSRPTIEINTKNANKRGIKDGDLCRLYNDRGESYCHAVVVEKLLDNVVVTQKQFKGSNTPNGLNINTLNTEELTDFGASPTFYSVLVEIEKVTQPIQWQGIAPSIEEYIEQWKSINPTSTMSDEEIGLYAKREHPEVYK